MLSILQTELFQVCSRLGNLHAVEPCLQPELLNHFLHSRDTGGTGHSARGSRAEALVGAGLVVPVRSSTAGRGEGRGSELCLEVSGLGAGGAARCTHAPPVSTRHLSSRRALGGHRDPEGGGEWSAGKGGADQWARRRA